jgi:uncharacterized protein YjbI with pentapeptide repeats
MRQLLTSLALLATFAAAGQVEVVYPYNPDGNADSVISAPDLLDLLPIFGGAFTPEEVTVNGEGLSTVLDELQSAVDSLSIVASQSSAATGGLSLGHTEVLGWSELNWYPDAIHEESFVAHFSPNEGGFLRIYASPSGCSSWISTALIPDSIQPPLSKDSLELGFPNWYQESSTNGLDFTIPLSASSQFVLSSGSSLLEGCTEIYLQWTPLQAEQVEVQSSFNATGLALGAREMYSFDMLTWQPLSGSNWAYYSAIELEADGLIEYVNDACANTEVFLVSDSLNEDDFTDGFLNDNAIRKYESTDFFSVVKANETLVIVSNENSEQCSSILMWVPLQVGSGQNLDSDEDVTSPVCEDIDEDGICDFADACMGMEVSFQFGSSEMLMSALFAEAGEYPSANLTDMDLSGVCAPQVKLYDASLSGSNFSGANLRGAVLVDATANEINLNHCDLSSASCISLHAMDASAISTDFSNADLYQALFSNANCANSNFQGTNLRSTNFTAANLSFCDFTDQDFTLTYLEGAQMESAILTGAVMNCLSVGCPSSLPDGYYCEPDPDCIYGGANDGYHRILAIE